VGRKRSVSMMLIELALLCLTRAAFFKRLTLAFARLASVPCQRLRDRRPPRGYVHMISREKLERHSCKCYGQIHSYVAGVFTICGLSSHAPVNLFGLGQILRRQTNV